MLAVLFCWATNKCNLKDYIRRLMSGHGNFCLCYNIYSLKNGYIAESDFVLN